MLITAAEVAEPMGGLSLTDSLLVSKVKDADSWAKQNLNRQFERAVFTRVIPGHGSNLIFLPESPIRALLEVRIDYYNGNFTSPDTIVSDLSRFRFESDPFYDRCQLYYIDTLSPLSAVSPTWGFPESTNAIQVKWEAGWWPADDPVNESDMPSDLRELVAVRARVKFKQAVGIKDDETTTFTDEYILANIRRYKR